MIPIPLGRKARLTTVPYVTSGLIILNIIVFFLTWPAEKKMLTSLPPREQLIDVSNRLASVLLEENSGLPEKMRAELALEKRKDDFPAKKAEEIFEAVGKSTVVLSGRAEYLWSQLYPLYVSVKKSLENADGSRNSIFYSWGAFKKGPYFPNYITYQFLHYGYLHIFFNMFFLWLVGCCVEDRWGPVLFLFIYLSGGISAVVIQNIVHTPGDVPMIGASGAVSAVIGAFLVRHYAVKIKMLFILFSFVSFRHYIIDLPAWVIIPLWIGKQVFDGLANIGMGSVEVGYWAHIGGFTYGFATGLVIKFTKIGKPWEDAAETTKVAVDEKIDRAKNLIRQNRLDEAEEILGFVLGAKPKNLDALFNLIKIYEIKNDFTACCRIGIKHMKYFENTSDLNKIGAIYDVVKSFTEEARLNADELVVLAQNLEKMGKWEEAVNYNYSVIKNFSRSPLLPKAILSAGRILKNKIGKPQKAKECFMMIIENDFDEIWKNMAREELA